jgi:hypothetical protein
MEYLSFAKTPHNPEPLLVTMLQAVAHAIHFKRILNFGESEAQAVLL